ncbi:TIM barrel protein [Sphingomonas sp. MG17]|uniref:TIM barrel protein n=1 Tax=Sphingomonas tagetis TaxID=2949092 RepID=A0A9X2HTZ2_9SPHN|nr:TIM barrel protein [Sphingomonas tagetis]MCP3732590.1 TIM barrel protein [Sphingomonas tagetis]
MPKFDANLLHLFTEVPFAERFELAAKNGFDAIELALPYDHDPNFLARQLDLHGLTVAVMNSPSGEHLNARGLACDPRHKKAFEESIDEALRYGRLLGRPLLHCLGGMAPTDVALAEVEANYIDNLRYAAGACAAKGVAVGIEAINPVDRPGYFVSSAHQALDLVAEIGEPNVGVILDIYHMAMTDEPLIELIERAGRSLFHVQIADVPGKGEPGTGAIDFRTIFDALDEGGYEGWVGLEYRPAGDTAEGLAWRQAFERPPTGAQIH